MIKIKFSWPMLFLGLILLLIWLSRDPDAPIPTPRRKQRRPRSGRATRGMIINADSSGSTYDAETNRLDHEAAEAGLRGRRPRPMNPLRNKEAYSARTAH